MSLRIFSADFQIQNELRAKVENEAGEYKFCVTTLKNCLNLNHLNSRTLDLLIFGYSDRRGVACHSHASSIQESVGAKRASSFDVSLGCSSLHLASILATSPLTLSGAKFAAVTSEDYITDYVNLDDDNHKSLRRFRNGGSSLLLSTEKSGLRLKYSLQKNVSKFHNNLFLKDGDKFFSGNSTPEEEIFLGRVYKKMYSYMLKSLIRRLSIPERSRVVKIILNQGSKSVVEGLSQEFPSLSESFIKNYDTFGHVGSSDFAIGIKDFLSNNPKSGDIVLVVTSSVGFAWLSSIWEWEDHSKN